MTKFPPSINLLYMTEYNVKYLISDSINYSFDIFKMFHGYKEIEGESSVFFFFF